MFRQIFLLAVLVVLAPCSASAQKTQGHEVTITGTLGVASLDSAVDAGEVSIGFLTHSPEAKVIFASCRDGDFCRVTGVVRGTGINAFFARVTKAVLVKRAR